MTNESKLGLLAGVFAVLVIAIAFYQKPGSTAVATTPPAPSGAGVLAPANTPTVPLNRP